VDREEALRLLKGGPAGIREWNQSRLAGKTIPELEGADLRGADLRRADLRRAVLRGADLTGAVLYDADLRMVDLTGAVLGEADLGWAALGDADLRGADLTGAILGGADLTGVVIGDANLHRARCWRTKFANLDLSEVKGLQSVRHDGPSTLGTDSLILSRGKIPAEFLRGCGLPDTWIAKLPALANDLESIEYYNVFFSYSTADEEFATRLHNDFQATGIRCWKWDHDARTGKSLWAEIDRAIRVHDKLVLVASESSLKSPQVNREIERAIRQEDERTVLKGQGKYEGDIDVLFPVRLDDFVFQGWEHERKADVTKKVIADARGWESDAKVYARVRDRLIKDLKAAGSTAR
jgi:hypothetical protein